MKIIDTVPSSTDKDVKVAVIKVGMDELDLILAVLTVAYKSTPRVIGTIPTLGRLRNMRRIIEGYINSPKTYSESQVLSNEQIEFIKKITPKPIKKATGIKECSTCRGYGLWAMGDPSPMGPIDSSDGMPTIACPECKANANPC